jgi:ribonucleotide monophosphatase NagD (HAD superfamily)
LFVSFQIHVTHETDEDVDIISLLWGNGYHAPRYGAGMFQEALSAVYTKHTGRELYRTVGGKPSSLTYDYASRLLQSLIGQDKRLGKVYMIGDNPESDIAGTFVFGFFLSFERISIALDSTD